MVYEAEIHIRRSDPQTLADDFRAVTELLEERRSERRQPRGVSSLRGYRTDHAGNVRELERS